MERDMGVEMKIKGAIRNELAYSELVLEGVVENEVRVQQEAYQIRMIQENNIPHLLKIKSCISDCGAQYLYDVSQYISMNRQFQGAACSLLQMKEFLNQLLEVLSAMNNYLLDINYLVLNPEYIFYKDEMYYFCYYPLMQDKIGVSFHTFTEYLVKNIDYGDYASVVLACGLHKETMKEQYNLLALIVEYTENENTNSMNYIYEEKTRLQNQREQLRVNQSLWSLDEGKEGTEEEQYIEKKYMEKNSLDMRTDIKSGGQNLKGKFSELLTDSSIKKYIVQKKKEKWGAWDDLLSQK